MQSAACSWHEVLSATEGEGKQGPGEDFLADRILDMFLWASGALCDKPGSVPGNPFQVRQAHEIRLSGNLMRGFCG